MQTNKTAVHTGLLKIFAELCVPDLKSWPSVMLAVSRSLEKLSQQLSIKSSTLALSRPQGVHIVARHNLKQWQTDSLTEYLESLHDRVESLSWLQLEIPRVYRLAGDASADGIPETSHIYRVNINPDEYLCGFFDFNREQVGETESMLASYLLHVAKTIQTYNEIQNQAEVSQALERANTELKATQVSLLNIMEDLRKRNEDLNNLNSLSSQFASCTSLEQLAEVATRATSDLLGGPIVALLVTTPDGNRLQLKHITGLKGDFDSISELELTDHPGRQLVELIDLPTDPPYGELCKAFGCKTGVASWLAGKTSLLGLLLVCENRWHRVFTDDELENLRFLSNTLAISIDNLKLLECTARQLHEMSTLKEYIETVVDSVDMAILAVDNNFRITMFSKGFERLYGYKPSDFIGKHLFEAFPHLLEQGFAEVIETVKAGKPFIRNGWRRRNLDGTEVVQNIRVFPHRDASGNIIGGITIITDVTEKVRLENQLDRSEAKFRKLVEELDDGYLVVAGGTIVYANRSVASMSGMPIHQLIGKNPAHLFPEASFLTESLNSMTRVRCESRIVHTSGTPVPVELTVYPCDYGGKQAISIIIRDITDRKNIEKELAEKNREMQLRNEQITRLNQELEATVNRLKQSQENLLHSEKIAMLSEIAVAANQEINQPLFSILGHAQLLLKEHSQPEDDTYKRLKQIEEAALRIACVTKKITNLAGSIADQSDLTKGSSSGLQDPTDLSEDLIVDSCQHHSEDE